jgi:hypothetical protein
MKNVSLYNEPIFVSIGKSFILIDALYLNDIKDNLDNVNKIDLQLLKKIVFPYNDIPFAEFTMKDNIFSVEKIKKLNVMKW